MARISLETLIGPVSIEEKKEEIISVGWQHNQQETENSGVLLEARSQLLAYFSGRLTKFDLPLAPGGTPFQKRIWSGICEIPLGETWTYGDLASWANTAPRAVGGACGANPIPIIIPCHRVVAANSGGGYSGRGGLNTKYTLLDLEKDRIHLM